MYFVNPFLVFLDTLSSSHFSISVAINEDCVDNGSEEDGDDRPFSYAGNCLKSFTIFNNPMKPF